ncbi:hypothetical protein DRN86_04540, partial [Candidatus Geothermarchaeota archaeon]
MADELLVAYSMLAEKGPLPKRKLKEKIDKEVFEKLMKKSLIVEQDGLIFPAFSLEEFTIIIDELIGKINSLINEIKDDSKSILGEIDNISNGIK